MSNIARRLVQAPVAVEADQEFAPAEVPETAVERPPGILVFPTINDDMLNLFRLNLILMTCLLYTSDAADE